MRIVFGCYLPTISEKIFIKNWLSCTFYRWCCIHKHSPPPHIYIYIYILYIYTYIYIYIMQWVNCHFKLLISHLCLFQYLPIMLQTRVFRALFVRKVALWRNSLSRKFENGILYYLAFTLEVFWVLIWGRCRRFLKRCGWVQCRLQLRNPTLIVPIKNGLNTEAYIKWLWVIMPHSIERMAAERDPTSSNKTAPCLSSRRTQCLSENFCKINSPRHMFRLTPQITIPLIIKSGM